jgi:hypothetical protein
MRYLEFANAQDILALWRVISDNTWAAIAQQAEAEAKQKAERAAARKSASKRGTAKPMPPKRLPPPLQHVTAPVPKNDKPNASAKASQATAQQPQSPQKPTAPTKATGVATDSKNLQNPNQLAAQTAQQPIQVSRTPMSQQSKQAQPTLTPQQIRLQRQSQAFPAKYV